MPWARETELINLEPMSGAQSLLGFTIGILAHRMLFSYREAAWISFVSKLCSSPAWKHKSGMEISHKTVFH